MPTPLHRPSRRTLRHAGAWLGGAVVLGLVFLLYAEPGFIVMMADQVWACF